MTTRDEGPDERPPADGANPLARLSWAGIIQLATRPLRPGARRRFLIGMCVALIPVVGLFALMGYSLRTARHVLEGEAEPLPEWGDPLELFRDAVRIFIVFFVFSIPANLVGRVASDSLFLSLISQALFLLAALLIPLAILRLARDEFGAAFQIGSHVRRVGRHPRVYRRLCAVVIFCWVVQFWARPLAGAYFFVWLQSVLRDMEPPALLPVALALVATVWVLVVEGVAIGLAGRLMEDDAEADSANIATTP